MSRPRVVIVGAGFAGYRAARTLARLTRNRADITLLNPTDYFLYLPLLPQVAAGVLEARRVTVSLPGTLRGVRLVLGEADGVDLDERTVHYSDPEGGAGSLRYDRLVLAVGSVNKLLPVPGVAEHAHGFRGLPEALYLRDHVTRQVELAAAEDDPGRRAARCTFVVVGAGYTGTEVAAHLQMLTDRLVRRRPLPGGLRPRWLLLDVAPRVLPEMDERLSRTADRVLRARGVDVRMGTSVKEATRDGVLLTDGEFVASRTLVWCVGVRPDPLVEAVGQPLERGRLIVDPQLQLPGCADVFACGDAAAVPDLERPGSFTPMTAQHAWRQGRVAGENVAGSLGLGRRRRPYRHRDLGFAVDLGGARAAANPLGVPLSGPAAGVVTRGYHLAALPGNRIRVAADWLLDAVLPRQGVQLGLVRSWSVPLDTASPELARVPGGPDRPSARTGGEPMTRESAPGKDPGRRTAAEPGKTEPAAEPGDNGPAAEPRDNGPAGEPGKNQPGGEAAKRQPGGEPARHQPGGEPARNQPGEGPARNQPGEGPLRDQPGGESARSRSGGESPRSRSGGESAGAGPGRPAPGPVKRTDPPAPAGPDGTTDPAAPAPGDPAGATGPADRPNASD
ncbi:FAD-dependent oxidoreductase [Streptomyces sp. EAS-AB2608]|uniref:FAD-dependent oxidoreductase n=1 Tax=Streptomyces sp. EAS-AB2608 TaxID=2779671 RepID=UPI0021A7C7B7|nr:FAD-dependent oxidoreductase [Streptomyces sp. EAS-AB2608]